MKVAEGYIAFVEELPDANTQGATLEEPRACPRSRWKAPRSFRKPVSGPCHEMDRSVPASGTRSPRHRELNDLLARKICDDLLVPRLESAVLDFLKSHFTYPRTGYAQPAGGIGVALIGPVQGWRKRQPSAPDTKILAEDARDQFYDPIENSPQRHSAR